MNNINFKVKDNHYQNNGHVNFELHIKIAKYTF